MTIKTNKYYLPAPSAWPLKASMALFLFLAGAANWLHSAWFGFYLTLIGAGFLIYVIVGWFGEVIHENRSGVLADPQVDRSFRYGMLWFIFSEVMFFGAFFGALFYVRLFVLPAMGDIESASHQMIWTQFAYEWPLLKNPDPQQYIGPAEGMGAWGLAAINTLILLTSGATITVAHFSLLRGKRTLMLVSQFATIALGVIFLFLQAHEYIDAYIYQHLTLASGIYGTTFYMLTGFHGLHVTIGAIGLSVILYRMFRHDFNEHNHFAFEAVSWYWHFVDVVWLFLFVFVYWL